MSDEQFPDGVTTRIGDKTVTASVVVDAPPDAVFDFIRRPANHPEISGDESVRGNTGGPDALSMGDRFGMNMRIGVPYWVRSRVVEFDEGRLIAWCHVGGHRWRWELEPTGDDRTRLTETFDMSTALAPFILRALGYPRRHESNVARSVANVAAHFASGPRSA